MISKRAAIYYDGLCIACSLEINHYRKLRGSEIFLFIDITSPEFIAEDHGIDPRLAHKVMHVRDTSGILRQGVDAFRAIWREIPRYRIMYRLSERKFIRSIMDLGYRFFVKVRPYLPRRKSDCSNSPYCDINNAEK